MTRPRRVLLVSDDELVVGGLAHLLDAAEGWAVVSSIEEQPDAVLFDLRELSRDGSSRSMTGLTARFPVVALSSGPSLVREALARGARGVLSRSSSGEQLVRALDSVLAGLVVIDEGLATEALRPPPRPLGSDEELTRRELEVLECLALGLSNRQIAERLGVSVHTTKFHVNSILGKLGASSRTEVLALAARAGLLTF